MAQHQHLIVVDCPQTGDKFELKGRPCELSAFSFVPPRRLHDKNRNFFNEEKHDTASKTNVYDRLFLKDYGYEEKIHRCDREHAKSRGLNVNDEEMKKPVPSLSSSVYGQNIVSRQIDNGKRDHAHVNLVKSDFYRRNGVNDLPLFLH